MKRSVIICIICMHIINVFGIDDDVLKDIRKSADYWENYGIGGISSEGEVEVELTNPALQSYVPQVKENSYYEKLLDKLDTYVEKATRITSDAKQYVKEKAKKIKNAMIDIYESSKFTYNQIFEESQYATNIQELEVKDKEIKAGAWEGLWIGTANKVMGKNPSLLYRFRLTNTPNVLEVTQFSSAIYYTNYTGYDEKKDEYTFREAGGGYDAGKIDYEVTYTMRMIEDGTIEGTYNLVTSEFIPGTTDFKYHEYSGKINLKKLGTTPIVIAVHGIGGGKREPGWAKDLMEPYGLSRIYEVSFRYKKRGSVLSFLDFLPKAQIWAQSVGNQIKKIAKEHPNQPIIIIAHSWGSVATTMALNGFTGIINYPNGDYGTYFRRPVPSSIKIAHLITIGSPLGLFGLKEGMNRLLGTKATIVNFNFQLSKPTNVGKWANFWDPDDPVSQFPKLVYGSEPYNYKVGGHVGILSAHTSIWYDEAVKNYVKRFYAKESEKAGGQNVPKGDYYIGKYLPAFINPTYERDKWEMYEGRCPYIYIWDGKEYIKTIEIIQNVIGKENENIQTLSMLLPVKSGSTLKLKIKEIKNEISYINVFEVFINDTKCTPVIFPDSLKFQDNTYCILRKGDEVELEFLWPPGIVKVNRLRLQE